MVTCLVRIGCQRMFTVIRGVHSSSWGFGEAEDKETTGINSVLHTETELFVVKIILLITSSGIISLHHLLQSQPIS